MIRYINHSAYLSIRALVKQLAGIFLFVFKGFRIEGRDRLPGKREAVIVISNHAAFVDSIYFICSIKPRFVICGAKPKYFRKPLIRFAFRIANILKIDNKHQYIEDCSNLLTKGEIILIYPEMGRYPDGMGEFKTWAAEVALKNGVSVIPCFFYGTTKGDTGRKKLIVGTKIESTGTIEEFTLKIKQAVTQLKPS